MMLTALQPRCIASKKYVQYECCELLENWYKWGVDYEPKSTLFTAVKQLEN